VPNWGATLYGEVRGAKDIRKPFWSMFWGLWVTVAMVALVVILIVKTMGWTFYNAAKRGVVQQFVLMAATRRRFPRGLTQSCSPAGSSTITSSRPCSSS